MREREKERECERERERERERVSGENRACLGDSWSSFNPVQILHCKLYDKSKR